MEDRYDSQTEGLPRFAEGDGARATWRRALGRQALVTTQGVWSVDHVVVEEWPRFAMDLSRWLDDEGSEETFRTWIW